MSLWDRAVQQYVQVQAVGPDTGRLVNHPCGVPQLSGLEVRTPTTQVLRGQLE